MPTENNDDIASSIGDAARDVASGKDISQTIIENNFSPPPPTPPDRYGPDHPAMQYSLADIVVALIGNQLTGEPGLVGKVKVLENAMQSNLAYQQEATKERQMLIEELEDLRRGQYPRWFQVLAIVLAVGMIVMLSVFLAKVW